MTIERRDDTLIDAIDEIYTDLQLLLWEHWEDFEEKDSQEKWQILMQHCDNMQNALGEELLRRES